MKMGGKKIMPNEELLALPRPDGDLIFKARAVISMTEFEALCPTPKPRMIISRTEGKIPDPHDRNFSILMEEYNEKRTAYMIIKSLEATESLEWDRVDINNPNTWLAYKEELEESGLADTEVNRIIMLVMRANALDQAKIDAARDSFLAGRAEAVTNLSSLADAQVNGASGEHVSV